MKKLSYLLLLLSNSIFAQITFEKGYFIDNAGQKTECLIKNEDWKDNPRLFYFKTNDEAPENSATIANVKEFGVINFSKYERHEVLIDTSEVDVAKLSESKNPQWSKKNLFLKLIIDGDAKLYEFKNGIQRRYFYSFKESNVEQLIYKEYYNPQDRIIFENKNFHQQLWNSVKCSTTKKERISKLGYRLSDLTKYFLEVNNCDGNKAITDEITLKKTSGFTNYSIKAGVNFSKLEIQSINESPFYPVEFENKTGLKLGLEIEHVLGFNKNKWAIYYEPTYQSYKSQAKKIIPSNTLYKWKANYACIDHHVGVRYFMFLNNNAKFFLSGGAVYKMLLTDEKIEASSYGVPKPNQDFEFNSTISLIGGLGFSYGKSNIEVRYARPTITQQYDKVYSTFNTFTILYGYKIFDSKKNK